MPPTITILDEDGYRVDIFTWNTISFISNQRHVVVINGAPLTFGMPIKHILFDKADMPLTVSWTLAST